MKKPGIKRIKTLDIEVNARTRRTAYPMISIPMQIKKICRLLLNNRKSL